MKREIYILITLFLFSLFAFLLLRLGNVIENLLHISKEELNYSFWINLWSSFFAAVFFTFFLFILNDFFLKEQELSGEWQVTENIEMAAQYCGYQIHYKFHILQKGTEIIGRGEKTHQYDENGELLQFNPNVHYITTIKLSGFIYRKYIKKTTINLVITEIGKKRITTASCWLQFDKKNNLSGTFASTAANSYGKILMRKRSLIF